MSLLGYDLTGTATINGLTEINANNVWSDVLYYDAGTTPVNVKTAINAISVDVTALEADVLTLQGQMTTVQGQITTLDGEVNTLQSEMNTAQSDINTLQSEMNTAQADIIALYSTTAATSATVAGLVVSQAAQDVTIASHTVSIGLLQAEDVSLDGRIDALEVKTSDQSWGSLSGTTFSTKTNVGTTSAGVVLNTSAASEFGSGLKTSSVEPLTVSSALAIGATQTSGQLNIGTLSTRSGQINIGSTTNANAQITIGSTASASQVVNINGANVTVGGTGTTNLALQSAPASNILFGTNKTGGGIYFGMYDATASTNSLNFNIGSLNTGLINFGTGASAKTITFGSAAATNNLIGTTNFNGITNINTTSFSNTNIGNGAAGGNFAVNAAANLISGTTNTLTSTGETEINCGVFDLNATSTATLDATGFAINATSAGIQTFATTSSLFQSTTTTTLTSGGETEINCAEFDLNASGALTADSNGGMTFTEATGTMYFNKTGATGGINFQSANFVSIDAADEFFLTGGGVAQMTSTGSTVTLTANQKIELNASNGNVDIRAFATDVTLRGDELIITTDSLTSGIVHNSAASSNWDMDLKNALNSYGIRLSETGTGGLTILGQDSGIQRITANGAASTLELWSDGDIGMSATDIVIEATGTSSGSIDIIANTNVDITATTGDVELTGTDVLITTTGTGVGEFVVRANTNVDIKTTTGNIELWANTTMLNKSGGTNTLEVNGVDKMVTTSSTTTLTNTNVAINGATTVTGATTINGNTIVNVDNTFNMMPTATIIQNVSATVPSGFLYCNGQAVSRTVTYGRLFAAIGTTFGVGNGTTTFNVPNFQGAFLRGSGTQTVSSIAYTAAAVGTVQQDMALTTPVSGYATPLSSTGFRSCGAGTRDCLARVTQGDPIENPTGLNLAYPSGRGGTEVRPMNHAVYYYIRY